MPKTDWNLEIFKNIIKFPKELFGFVYHFAKHNRADMLSKIVSAGGCLGILVKDETPVERLAREGEFNGVDLLLNTFGGDVNKAAYGYAAGGHIQAAYDLLGQGAEKGYLVYGFARAGLVYDVTQCGVKDKWWLKKNNIRQWELAAFALQGYAQSGLMTETIDAVLNSIFSSPSLDLGRHHTTVCKAIAKGYAQAQNKNRLLQILAICPFEHIKSNIAVKAIKIFTARGNIEAANEFTPFCGDMAAGFYSLKGFIENDTNIESNAYIRKINDSRLLGLEKIIGGSILFKRMASRGDVFLVNKLLTEFTTQLEISPPPTTNTEEVFFIASALTVYLKHFHINAWEKLMLSLCADFIFQGRLDASADAIFTLNKQLLLRLLSFIHSDTLRSQLFNEVNTYRDNERLSEHLLKRANTIHQLMNEHQLNYSQALALSEQKQSDQITKLFYGVLNTGARNMPTDVTAKVTSYLGKMPQQDATELFKKEKTESKQYLLRNRSNIHTFFESKKEAIEARIERQQKRKKSHQGSVKRQRVGR